MNEEERRTMINMGKGIDALAKRIKALEDKNGPRTIPVSTGSALGASIQQTIEHVVPKGKCVFQVIHDEVSVDPELRRMNAERFLKDIQELFQRYRVISLHGDYEAR
jgi:ATP-dependent DNA ligase